MTIAAITENWKTCSTFQFFLDLSHVLLEDYTLLYLILPLSCHCSLSIPPKDTENLWFSGVFRGIERDKWHEIG